MNSDSGLIINYVSGTAIILLVPAVCLFWRLTTRATQFSRARFVASIGCGWVLLVLHREFIEWPIMLARHHNDDDMIYDGLGGNAAVLVFGWLPMLIVTVLYWLVSLVWWRLRRRGEMGANR
jgi:hypothetical protein